MALAPGCRVSTREFKGSPPTPTHPPRGFLRRLCVGGQSRGSCDDYGCPVLSHGFPCHPMVFPWFSPWVSSGFSSGNPIKGAPTGAGGQEAHQVRAQEAGRGPFQKSKVAFFSKAAAEVAVGGRES